MWTKRISWPVRSMHEWPLVLFTALGIAGAGIFGARLLAEFAGLLPSGVDAAHEVATILLFAGLAASFAPLGRPMRAALALARAGRNTLSTEVVLSLAVLGFGVLLLVPDLPTSTREVAAHIAGGLSLGLLVMFGLVYFLPARRPWRGPLVAGPFVSGLAAGTIVLVVTDKHPSLWLFAIGFLLIDFWLFARPWRRASRPARNLMPAHPLIFEHRGALMMLRFLLVSIVPVGFLVGRLPLGAAIGVGIGLLVDRFAFYGLVLEQTTEAEMARVERLIGQ